MSANENEVLTGLEPYRNPFQILIGYDHGTEEYEEARSRVYDELQMDVDVSRMDQFHVLQSVMNGEPEEAFEYLSEEVLEDEPQDYRQGEKHGNY